MGSLWCWIPEILSSLKERLRPKTKEKKTRAISRPLPEGVVTQILSRLPANSLHECAKVYDDWNSLFSTHYFIHDLFLPRASLTIIVHRSSNVEDELFYLDDFPGDDKKKTPINLKVKDDPLISRHTRLRFSCFGLLFFTNSLENYTVVLNPITREKTYLLHHCEGHSEICGVYSHPNARQFFALLVSWSMVPFTHEAYDYAEFKLFGERGAPRCWKTLSKFSYQPVTEVPPINLHGALHWMRAFRTPFCSQSIVVFSITEEEFKLMPHPKVIPVLTSEGKSDKEMHLFDLDGNLALCQIADVLEIWTLEDYASWFWTKTHTIKLGVLDHIRRYDWVKVLGIQNGALIIHSLAKGIFVCHLQQNTTKKFIFDKLKGSDRETTVCLHTKSLVSNKLPRFLIDKIYLPDS